MIRQCVAYDERPPTALGLKDLPVCPFKQGDAHLRTVGQLETDGKPRIECHGSAPHDVRASKHVVFTRRTDADGVEMSYYGTKLVDVIGLQRLRSRSHQLGMLAGIWEEDRKSTRLNSSPLMRISYAVFCLKKKKHHRRKIDY